MTVREILAGTLDYMTSGWAMPFTVVALVTLAVVVVIGDERTAADVDIDEWSNV